MVVGLLIGFALWSSNSGPPVIRGAAALFEISIAAGAAWGRWRGRAVDAWAMDALRFAVTNHQLSWHPRLR